MPLMSASSRGYILTGLTIFKGPKAIILNILSNKTHRLKTNMFAGVVQQFLRNPLHHLFTIKSPLKKRIEEYPNPIT